MSKSAIYLSIHPFLYSANQPDSKGTKLRHLSDSAMDIGTIASTPLSPVPETRSPQLSNAKPPPKISPKTNDNTKPHPTISPKVNDIIKKPKVGSPKGTEALHLEGHRAQSAAFRLAHPQIKNVPKLLTKKNGAKLLREWKASEEGVGADVGGSGSGGGYVKGDGAGMKRDRAGMTENIGKAGEEGAGRSGGLKADIRMTRDNEKLAEDSGTMTGEVSAELGAAWGVKEKEMGNKGNGMDRAGEGRKG